MNGQIGPMFGFFLPHLPGQRLYIGSNDPYRGLGFLLEYSL